jgi:aminoglycoside phosphotransferase (APT) family kinase protein
MHEGEITINDSLIRRLLMEQFPDLAGLPIHSVHSTGTVNAIYRIGDSHCLRLPRIKEWAADIEKEWKLLPYLAPNLTLRIPEPVALGAPREYYPFQWAVYRWLEGVPYGDDIVDDEQAAAADLARFVVQLRQVKVQSDAPKAGRRALHELDIQTRKALEASADVIDCGAAAVAWGSALKAPAWNGTAAWIHADLLKPNLLLKNGKLSAVIDFGSSGVGDPAFDVVPAWSVFRTKSRQVFRYVLDVDGGTWSRARGYALHQAALIIPYYQETNPEFVAMAKRVVEEVIVDTS